MRCVTDRRFSLGWVVPGSNMPFLLLFGSFKRIVILFLVCGFCAVGVQAQTPPSSDAGSTSAPPKAAAAPPATPDQTPSAEARPKDEVVTHDTPPSFQVRVNLVQVRVVVRDESGKVIPNLHREDFQIFDNRKPQLLSSFNVDTPEAHAAAIAVDADAGPEKSAQAQTAAVVAKLPQRFVAMVFDDVHMSLDDAMFVRTEAAKFFASLAPTDRIGIYSSSGQTSQEFTDDREVLRKTLLGILPKSVTAAENRDCPFVSYYMADQIVNVRDPQALTVAAADIVQCEFNGDQTKLAFAMTYAQSAAAAALATGDGESSYTYTHLNEVTRRLSAMPGQRIMVFVSPGFIPTTLRLEMSDLIERANRANITINTIDARGLYTPELMGDISERASYNPLTVGVESLYRTQAQFAQQEVLSDLALGTGGTFFHNRNDVAEGMKEAGAAPEVSYLLGFSPQNLKIDGRFHELKVTLTSKRKATIQARRGYYAPRTIPDPAEAAKADIQEAIFSQDEIHDIPIDLQTQFFKKDANDARIAVLMHFDVKGVHFRKAAGRSDDDLTIATAIFDQNGNFVTGGEKVLTMKLLDQTYERLSRSGLTVKSSFDVKPGTYMVRLVVRDAEGSQMAARNGAVVIPF
jgi:VWFA-related protein